MHTLDKLVLPRVYLAIRRNPALGYTGRGPRPQSSEQGFRAYTATSRQIVIVSQVIAHIYLPTHPRLVRMQSLLLGPPNQRWLRGRSWDDVLGKI